MTTRKLLYFYAFLVLSTLIWSATSGGRATQAMRGNTNAPGEDGTVCFNCHNGGNYTSCVELISILDLSTNLPATSYIPGNVYQVNITVLAQNGNPGGYGFQACSLDENNADIGKWVNLGANVQSAIVPSNFVGNLGDRVYVEQNGTSSTNQFTMNWEAPTVDEGDITFYYIGNCVNGTGNAQGDNGGFGSSLVFPAGCAPDLDLTGVIPSEIYEASNSITSNGEIQNNEIVEFIAGDCISLNGPFEVAQGADFTATVSTTACQ